MNFRASFCHPLQPHIIELGVIQMEDIVAKFETTPWADYLLQMQGKKEEDIYYSPSLEIENSDTRHGLSISAVGDPENYEFYIYYKRPKVVKSFFGLSKKLDENYLTEITGQTREDGLECLKALTASDVELLERKIG